MGRRGANSVYSEQCNVLKDMADKSDCVIVGRCADYILRDHPNLFSVFITADTDFRVKRAIEIDGVDPDKAYSVVNKHDKQRRRHYNYYTGMDWGARANYHLILNTGKLGVLSVTDILTGIIQSE